MNLNNRHKYQTGKDTHEIFLTSELKAYQAKFADPLIQCFKLMVDFDKPYGLLADESNVDSALAYLKRIGETTRYETLKQWIEIFKVFIKDYDFLILGVEGLDIITNIKPNEVFTENDKITFSIRETSDMLCQSLLTQYRHIWYDNNRGVEVLPANLRKFDLNVLIYSAGYYNMALYDVLENNGLTDNDVETKMFPTLKKLSDKYFFHNAQTYNFNHHLVSIGSASINTEESGKTFFSSLTNEQTSDYIKNTLTINFRFGQYKGVFNNLFGEFDFVKTLALIAAQDRLLNESNSSDVTKRNKFNLKDFFSKSKDSFKSNALSTIDNIKSKPAKYLESIVSPNIAIGNALKNITDPNFLPKLVKNTVDLGIKNLEDRYVYDPLANINNMILKSFSNNLIDVYDNYLSKSDNVKNQPKLLENDKTSTDNNSTNPNNYSPGSVPNDIRYGVKFGTDNIYNRKGF